MSSLGSPSAGRDERDGEDALHVEVSNLGGGTRLPWRPQRKHVRVAQAVSVVVVVAVLLGVLVLPHVAQSLQAQRTSISTSPAAGTPKPRTPISYTGQPLTCPFDAAWSPDGQTIAVLYYLACGSGTLPLPSGGAMAVYTDPARPPVAVLALDPFVVQHGLPAILRSDAREMSQLYLDYTSISWSPDGKTIAVTYVGTDVTVDPSGQGFGSHPDPQVGGLITVHPSNIIAPVRVINQLPASSAPSNIPLSNDPNQPLPATLLAWDLASGQPQLVNTSESLAYRWGPNDALIPTEALTPSGVVSSGSSNDTALGPVVQPDHSAFSLWQVAQVQVTPPPCAADGATPMLGGPYFVAVSLQVDTPVWSPDGKVFIPSTFGQTGLVDARVSDKMLASSGCVSQTGGPGPTGPKIPVRDAGLRAALGAATSQGALVYWRPDGQRLVMAQEISDNTAANSGTVLTVYDCASGKVITSVALPLVRSPFIYDGTIPLQPRLVWSPDGQRLLVLGTGKNGVTVLGVAQLGG